MSNPLPTSESPDQPSRLDPEPGSRRDFLGRAALLSAGAAMLFAGAGMARLPRAAVVSSPSKKFRVTLPESLPPGAVWDPIGMVFSVQALAPEETQEGGATLPAVGASGIEGSPGQVTWKRDLWPQHQDVLRRYFTNE